MCNNKKELYDIIFCYNAPQRHCDIKILVLKLMCLLNKKKFFDIKLN